MFLNCLSPQSPFDSTYFYISKFCLVVMGYWPANSVTIWRSFLMIVHFLILLVGSISEIIFGTAHLSTEPLRAMDAYCPCASRVVTMLKFVVVFSYRKEITEVMTILKDLIDEETKSGQDKRMMAQRLSRTANMFAFLVMCCGGATNTFYTLRPLFANLMQFIKREPILLDDLPFSMAVPSKSMEMPYYLVTFSLVSYSGYVTILGFAGVDGFFIGFCMYCSILLKLLQRDVKEALSEVKGKWYTTEKDNIRCHFKLEAIIKRHNAIINLVVRFTGLFSAIILGHFVSAALVIGAGMIELLLLSGFESILYVAHTAATLSQLFVYCYGGSAIFDGGQAIADAVFTSEWYKFDTRNQKTALMILMRSQRSMKIEVPFFSPSLEAYASMVRTAGSYCALLKTVL